MSKQNIYEIHWFVPKLPYLYPFIWREMHTSAYTIRWTLDTLQIFLSNKRQYFIWFIKCYKFCLLGLIFKIKYRRNVPCTKRIKRKPKKEIKEENNFTNTNKGITSSLAKRQIVFLLLRVQCHIITVIQSLIFPVAGPQWVFPGDGVYVIVVLVIKSNRLLFIVHPLNHLTKGGKSQ